MPKVIVTFKDTTSDAEYAKAKEDLIDQGGKITDDYSSLMKGFAAEIPDGFNLQSLSSFAGDKVTIEGDGTVRTQTVN
ncbi:hypothetical protein NP233_g4069 [Leucocoprinus birnbaumii]|uniref:Inhibitor I9 domain-containing protein n=1 Tax=Leucocoprinus birnbaumii TaxID=56174 RepID=A0AAD5VZ41_9AGAR|nr:hypothetical protein NP233_g4069 [Leucocoprinus birnbaumii]